MTNLSNIENIILRFKQGRDYVVASENDGKTKKLVYTIRTDELKNEVSPFPKFANVGVEGLKAEEGNRHDGYFSYEVGDNGKVDKFTIIVGLEASQRETQALRRPREIEQRMKEIEQRQKLIAQQMQEVRESGGPEIINTTSYIERRREDGRIVEDVSQATNYTPSGQPISSQVRGINDNEDKQEQRPLAVQPLFPHKK